MTTTRRSDFRAIALSASLLAGFASTAYAQSSSSAINAGAVSATNGANTISTEVPTQQQIFESGQTTRVLDRTQLDTLGPVGGGAQSVGLAPGGYVVGYGNTGSTKYTIGLDGVMQGWGGYGGYTGGGSLMVTMDGIPMVDPETGLWPSATVPQQQMFQATQITYGPGTAIDRWYDNIGGNIEFTPIQPTAKAGGDIHLSYGSFDQKNLAFDVRSGNMNGWSTVIAGGAGKGDNFRSGYGFHNPNKNDSFFIKTIKTFAAGHTSFGGYYARSEGYRAQVIPVEPNSALTVNGQDAAGNTIPGTLYSQKTSGFYSTVPYSVYNKYDINQIWMLYNKTLLHLDKSTDLHNILYYAREDRLHKRLNDGWPADASNQQEYNNPYTWWYGDKVWLSTKLAFNTPSVGSYYQYSTYNTRNAFFNPADGGSAQAPNAKYRSDYFNQSNLGLFFQDEITPIPILHITPGVRWVTFTTQYHNGAAQDFPNATGTDQGSLTPAQRTLDGYEPSIDVSLQPIHWLSLYANYGEALRTPQVGGGGGLYQKIPASYARLARGQEIQVGFKSHVKNLPYLHNLLLGANYFHLKYSKQTISFGLANGDSGTAFGTSVYQGANIFVDDDPYLALHIFGNASIINATYTNYETGSVSNPTYYNGLHVPYVPKLKLNIGVHYKFLYDGFLIDPRAWWDYTGAQYIFDNNAGAPSNQTMPAWNTFNLGVSTSVPFNQGAQTAKLSLQVLNVTDKKYNIYEYITSGGYYGAATAGDVLAYPAAPLTLYATLSFKFG